MSVVNTVSRSRNATLKKLGWRVGLAAAFIATRSGRGCTFQRSEIRTKSFAYFAYQGIWSYAISSQTRCGAGLFGKPEIAAVKRYALKFWQRLAGRHVRVIRNVTCES